ncbi:MAG: hypothetical protein COZ06_26360 [Armatimonadetes bacterium CG_4_10_14_3_um_filter_66_18]|nr:hypothetical protein [Armatimonadota bacterium]OIO93646.1 MAG: hypothetical protein AUJ96_29845 [Armatimonadetes bacterium CG2_30_66_41]PIU95266.1 MAG: hypothetical protein COS65_03330 [Armatimonadetes bacterium CG06_land_8_20_14_3_00_66_21]PIX41560.1 MAG: hypothetical protein COZ57_23170 [Armatimonadetes bacterium CG_4_8_14_3_um_filter_66_20]PIY41671.1 MAG: hypothetical protein COZ06_26360 [Armatimonadetes bacterium CG_4_10_14_3_um_filter_66_18]PIZ47185.1 MAG: hypothetical protein COY42_09
MKTYARWVLVLTVVVTLLIAVVPAKRAEAAEYPQVAQLKEFSPEAGYMSLAGYLRYLMFVQDGSWMSRAEASRIVKQQRQ